MLTLLRYTLDMYFSSRMQAGRMLASQLDEAYHQENCAIIALNDGGVMVGVQIAMKLHCVLTMLLTEEIQLPREPLAIGGITAEGSFIYNQAYSAGEIEEISGEYRNTIEQEKLVQLHKMNELLGSEGLISRRLLTGRTIIIVSDGLEDGFLLDMVMQFLKPVAITKLVVATPLASIKVTDQLHVSADEIYCLYVPDEYISTDHYYDTYDVPDHATAIATIERIVYNWK
jgi:putative phosphoribosyl transferase